jgi:dethiobiotin synthetase
MNPKGFFVTGTDTEVGKTLVAAALILKLQEQGIRAIGYKPVAAGLKEINGKFINDDVETLLMVSRRVDPTLTVNDICPYLLSEPAAPHLVAEKYGVDLNIDVIFEGYKKLDQRFDAVIVEGAGGFLVPINENCTLGDFAKKLNLPVLLVVNIKLGCINHTLLTIEAIRKRGLTVHGWMSNNCQPKTAFSNENITTLEKILNINYGVKKMGEISYFDDAPIDHVYTFALIKKVSNVFDSIYF